MEPVHVNELLKHVGISEPIIDQSCSDEHIKLLSVSLKWRSVAPHLGLSTADIEAIEYEKKSESERRLKTLQIWKEKFAFKATYKRLIEALLTVNSASYAQEICTLLKSEKDDSTTMSTPCPSTVHEDAITDISAQSYVTTVWLRIQGHVEVQLKHDIMELRVPKQDIMELRIDGRPLDHLEPATTFTTPNICDQYITPGIPFAPGPSALLTSTQLQEQSRTPPAEIPQLQELPLEKKAQKTEENHFDIVAALLGAGVPHIVLLIMSYVSLTSLTVAEKVSTLWRDIIEELPLWKQEVQRNVETSPLWQSLFNRRGWHKYASQKIPHSGSINLLFRQLYRSITKDIHSLGENWRRGHYTLTRIETGSSLLCLQYDSKRIVSGHEDNTIKIWDKVTLELLNTLNGHNNYVYCLQFTDDVIMSGSWDHSIKVWDTKTGQMVNNLLHHKDRVNSVKFKSELLASGSSDRTVAVWEFKSPTAITLRMVLNDEKPVSAVEISDSYIISGSWSKLIKIWNSLTGVLLHTLKHSHGVTSLQCRGSLILSGCWDGTTRLWDFNHVTGQCLRWWKGHENVIQCVAFKNEKIMTGSWDKTVKVWSMYAGLEPSSSTDALCVTVLKEHSQFVFGVQFDEFEVISGGRDGMIYLYDFLDPTPPDHILEPK